MYAVLSRSVMSNSLQPHELYPPAPLESMGSSGTAPLSMGFSIVWVAISFSLSLSLYIYIYIYIKCIYINLYIFILCLYFI